MEIGVVRRGERPKAVPDLVDDMIGNAPLDMVEDDHPATEEGDDRLGEEAANQEAQARSAPMIVEEAFPFGDRLLGTDFLDAVSRQHERQRPASEDAGKALKSTRATDAVFDDDALSCVPEGPGRLAQHWPASLVKGSSVCACS